MIVDILLFNSLNISRHHMNISLFSLYMNYDLV